jgi:thiol-disulfide isomerase/thioredoxin
LERLLDSALKSCAIIFFTSSTCAPCKIVYPAYDELAAEAGSKGIFIKVDINNAYDVSAKYGVRSTPTFMFFLRGQKHDEWSGADERRLRSAAKMLLDSAFPPHPHLSYSVPMLLRTSLRPISYPKVPPLDKLTAKMGEAGKDPAVTSIVAFVRSLSASGAIESRLPDLPAFAKFLQTATSTFPQELLFTALDLLRSTLSDPRVSGFFAEEHTASTTPSTTITHILTHVTSLGAVAPYNLRLTTLHLACNLFSSPLFIPHLLSPPLSSLLITLLTTALLDEKHVALRASAMSLAMNLAGANHKIRTSTLSSSTPSSISAPELPEGEQVELLASLLEILGQVDENEEVRFMGVVCTGWLTFCAPQDGEVRDLCLAMDAKGTVEGVKLGKERREGVVLVKEVGGLAGKW